MSGEASRIRDGLADLDRRSWDGEEVAMAPPGPEILDAFGIPAPTDVVMDYLSVMNRYQSFTPRLSRSELADLWVRTQLRHGDGATGLHIAAPSRRSSLPELRPGSLVKLLARHAPLSDRGVEAASGLVRHLLDSDLGHQETFDALSDPANRAALDRVIREVSGWLDPEERDALGV
jgi:hypothetical protein